MLFDFGQPMDGIFQVAFVVEDLDAAMEEFSANFGIGPWTELRNVGTEGTFYRGEPSRATSHIGFGFSGHMAYELIQPVNDAPSTYRDVIEDRGYGFHHFGCATTTFEDSVAALAAAGHEQVGSVERPGLRIAMFDTRAVLPGLTELIEASDAVNASFTAMWKASIGEGDAPAPPPPAPPSLSTT